MDLILRLVFFLQDEKICDLQEPKGENWLGEEEGDGGKRDWVLQWSSVLSARGFRTPQSKPSDHFPSFRRFWLCRVQEPVSLSVWHWALCGPARGLSVRWSPAFPGDTATCQETGLRSELGRFWFWTAGKSLLFFLNLDCCLHKLWSFCTVCVPFFPFMQSFSALAAEICLVEKTRQRAASEGG